MHSRFIIKLYVYAGSAEAGPPLGTVLGNLGVNALKFSKEFNEFTSKLPIFFLVPVVIIISESKSYSFLVGKPATSFFINIFKFDKFIRLYKNKALQKVYYINFFNFIRIILFKFRLLNILESMHIVLGTMNSCKVKLIF